MSTVNRIVELKELVALIDAYANAIKNPALYVNDANKWHRSKIIGHLVDLYNGNTIFREELKKFEVNCK